MFVCKIVKRRYNLITKCEFEINTWKGFDFQIIGIASQTAKEVWLFGIQTTGAMQFDLKIVRSSFASA